MKLLSSRLIVNCFLEAAINKATKFFRNCILPELMGKLYSHPKIIGEVVDEDVTCSIGV